ncbi:MAG: hypothetical protein ACI9C9_000954 [Marivirga sp.]|jgi:hypothetical protein
MNFQQPQAFWLAIFLLLPIIIHLFQFRRYKRLQFSNVAFLKEVTESKKQQRNLKHLLILFCRLLFIAAFIVCLAKPNWPNSSRQQSPQIIILDNSPSMLTITEGKDVSVYEEMLQSLNKLNEVYPSVQIELLDGVGKPFKFYRNPAILNSQTSMNLKAILDNFDGGNIVLASDFQKQLIQENATIFNDTAYQFVLLPAYRNAPETVSWDSIWTSQSEVSKSEVLNIQLIKYGSKGKSNVSALLGDNSIGSIQANFETSDRQIATISMPQSIERQSQLTLQTNDLSYFDNLFYAIYEQDSLLKVLYLYNEVSDPLVYNAYSDDRQFELVAKQSSNFSYQSLSDYSIAVIEMNNDFSITKAESLSLFAEKGGTLILVPKEGFDQLKSLKLLGFSDLNPNSSGLSVPLQTPDYNNPFFKGVFQEKKQGLDMADVKLSFTTSTGMPLLQTVDGRPFLTKLQLKGSIFLFAGLLNSGGQAFVKSPLFLPTFYRMAFSEKEQGRVQYSYLNEEVIDLDYLGVPNGAVIKLRSKEQTFIPDQRISGAGLQIILPKNELSPGFWEVVDAKTETLYGKIAFNYPKEESMASYFTANALQDIFRKQSNVKVLDNMEFETISSYMEETKSDIPLWKYFLILALLSLFAEVAIIRFIK